MKNFIAGSLLALCAVSTYSDQAIRQVSSQYKDGLFLTNNESGYVMQIHNSEGFKVFDQYGDEFLNVGTGYKGLAMQGDYVLFSSGETNVYHCQLSKWNNQEFSEYLSSCNNINTAKVSSNSLEFAYSTGNSRSLNSAGYGIMMSRDDNNSSVIIYPDGRQFTIPQVFTTAYISDTTPPYAHFLGKSWVLNSSGPALISSVDTSEFTENDIYQVIGHTQANEIYVSAYKMDRTNPTNIYSCEFNGDVSTRDASDLTMEEGINILVNTNMEPGLAYLFKNYPKLPDDIATVNDLFGFELPLDTTDSQFEQLATSLYDTDIGPYINTFFSDLRFLPCKEGTTKFINHKPVINQLPIQLINEQGDFLTIGRTTNWHQNYSSKYSPTILTANNTEVELGSILSDFLLGQMSETDRNTLLQALVTSNVHFTDYPNYPSDLTNLGFRMIATNSDLDSVRSAIILEQLGFILSDGSNFSWVMSMLPSGSILLSNAGLKGEAWVIALTEQQGSEEVIIDIKPFNPVIDPYAFQTSNFSIDVSGSNIYGLDVSCNLSSASLSVTQANYDALFSSQNTMTLPLIYDATSVTGTETLVAPELPFAGAGSFVLADVIAEFTTEDVEITCAAEVSDENGQLLQVTLTPATIRIDDGVHGGTGSVSGVIVIPGVTDLSDVEVVLTIDGRQVTVTTDETGRFEFDGLRDGDFTVSLASDNYVQSCQAANVTEGGAIDLGSIELLAGDINADGNIDIADFTFMAARYRSNQGDADYDAKADLNKDGTINIQDLAILGSHFGSTQCNL